MTDNKFNLKQSKRLKRALIVEDDPLVARVCTKILAGFGFTSDQAANGSAALSLAENTCYDFYLSEVRVPGISGLKLLEHLTRNHSRNNLRIVFTAADLTGDVVGTIATDTSVPIVLKPFSPEELRKIIRKTIMEKKK